MCRDEDWSHQLCVCHHRVLHATFPREFVLVIIRLHMERSNLFGGNLFTHTDRPCQCCFQATETICKFSSNSENSSKKIKWEEALENRTSFKCRIFIVGDMFMLFYVRKLLFFVRKEVKIVPQTMRNPFIQVFFICAVSCIWTKPLVGPENQLAGSVPSTRVRKTLAVPGVTARPGAAPVSHPCPHSSRALSKGWGSFSSSQGKECLA